MDKIYCYPNSNVLINKFGIQDIDKLETAERKATNIRLLYLICNPINGNFDLQHLQNVHKFIFQDVYEWAGNLRIVDIAKGNLFCLNQNISSEANRIFNGIKKENCLCSLNIDRFSDRLGYYSGEINALHPFREGNGRSTREFIRCLAANAGYEVRYDLMDKEKLFNAFVKSFLDYSDLKELYKEHICDSIKNNYKNQLPKNFVFSEELLNNFHSLKVMSKDKSYLPIEKIKAISDLTDNKNHSSFVYKISDSICKEINLQCKGYTKDLSNGLEL